MLILVPACVVSVFPIWKLGESSFVTSVVKFHRDGPCCGSGFIPCRQHGSSFNLLMHVLEDAEVL